MRIKSIRIFKYYQRNSIYSSLSLKMDITAFGLIFYFVFVPCVTCLGEMCNVAPEGMVLLMNKNCANIERKYLLDCLSNFGLTRCMKHCQMYRECDLANYDLNTLTCELYSTADVQSFNHCLNSTHHHVIKKSQVLITNILLQYHLYLSQ